MKNIIYLSLTLGIFVFSCQDKSNNDAYLLSIDNHRKEIMEFMKNNENSPFHKKGDIPFLGLNYYEIDPSLNISARIERYSSPEPIEIMMSDGTKMPYFNYAKAIFELEGQPQELVLLKSEQYWEEDWLFLPFYDETSAIDTYGGGRFLEVIYSGGEVAMIDFNKAYNPYCAYTDTYRCPIPPAGNRISVAVRAGEKNYQDHH